MNFKSTSTIKSNIRHQTNYEKFKHDYGKLIFLIILLFLNFLKLFFSYFSNLLFYLNHFFINLKYSHNPKDLSKKINLANLELDDENLIALKKYLDLLYDANNILRKRIKGTLYHDDSFYIGEHKNNLKHGVGVYFFPQKRYYGGSFRNDLIHGHGILIYENGDRYEGNFENGVKSGKGAYFFKEGSVYRGRFGDDMFQGFGVLTSASGGRFNFRFL
jgi:hypothetical protein